MHATHTPGPWTARKWSCHAETTVTVDDLDCVTGKRTIADCESEADAKLIAAAPELLSALRAIVKSLSDQDDEGLIEHAQQMIDARAAIAKATGGAA